VNLHVGIQYWISTLVFNDDFRIDKGHFNHFKIELCRCSAILSTVHYQIVYCFHERGLLMNHLIAATAILLVSLTALSKTTETKSAYTDLKADCIVVSSSTDKAQIDFYTAECKAYGGYALRITGGDLRYGPELAFNGVQLDLARPFGFHDLGSDKIEWVYDLARDEEGNGEIHFKALIYRLNVADQDGHDKSFLYVVRLNGEQSCVIGSVTNNEGARDLANDISAKCAKRN
jgi:hypothetical protein